MKIFNFYEKVLFGIFSNMRQLSKEEITICKEIIKSCQSGNIKSRSTNILFLLDPMINNAILFFTETQEVKVLYDENSANINFLQKLYFKIILIINLLKLLEKEGYIFLAKMGRYSFTDIGTPPDTLNSSFNLPDENLSQLLIEYSQKDVFITEEFVLFCKMGYRARDEQRFRKQVFISTIALSVSIIALLLNITINIKSLIASKISDSEQEKHENVTPIE